VLDATKDWDLPLIEVGTITLDKNPLNFFAETEQVAFAVSNMVTGIEPSNDRILQGRLFAYGIARNYRLGINSYQIPINCPFRSKIANYERDGIMRVNSNEDGT
jgi:catalase